MATRLGKLSVCASARSVAKSVSMLGIALCGSWILVGCGGATSSAPPPTLQSISVIPQNNVIAAGLKLQFIAQGYYSDGSSKLLVNVTWASSNASVATVNSTGLVTGVMQGNVTISATSGAITGSAAVTIGPPLLPISISPQPIAQEPLYIGELPARRSPRKIPREAPLTRSPAFGGNAALSHSLGLYDRLGRQQASGR